MNIFSSKPQRFFRAFSISGQPADLGFECQVCHSVIRYGLLAGQTVEHCGKREEVPSSVFGMQCRSLRRGMPLLPEGYIVTDTWDSVGGWDEENAQKSDDPSAFEVGWV
jgi:hypothetical protein